VYGTLLQVDGHTRVNSAPGLLLRSKPEDKEDGGVAAGVACLDSPWVVEQQ
jgi:hypothetical protein